MARGTNKRAGLGVAVAAVLAAVLLCPATAAAQKSVAHIRLSGQVTEAPPAFALSFDQDRATLRSYAERLDQAARDRAVQAVLVTFDQPQLGWAQMLELRSAFARARSAGKPLWVYMEQGSGVDYMLAAAADRIVLAPAGMIDLVGLNLHTVFFKGLLDKIGVQADMIQVGRFKGAAEPFTRTEPSAELAGELNRALDGLFAQLVAAVAEGRKLPADKVKALIDAGPYLADDARKAGLVDRVATRGELIEALGVRLGGEPAIQQDYGKPAGLKLDLSNPFALLGKMLGEQVRPPLPARRIALVYLDGVIVSGESEQGLFGGQTVGSETIRKALDQARVDPNVRAIVLRIDSPGGSALASDVIWQAVRHAAGAKPVVVSVGGMAASGGYYIACGAPTIFAEPGSLVGSIGVVGGKIVVGPLLGKLGVSTASFSRGANAALFDPAVPFTDEQRQVVEGLMDKIYAQFLSRVRSGRGERIKDLDAVAQGRIFLGGEANEKGMVDRIGGLDEAIRFAAGQARIEQYEIDVTPAPKTLIDLLADALTGGGQSRAALSAWQRSVVVGVAGLDPEALARLLPVPLRQLATQLTLLRLLQSEQVLAAWPCAAEAR